MPSPTKVEIEAFERQYEIEFKQYQEENKKDTVVNTIRRYPVKNLILFTLAVRSFVALRHSVAQLTLLPTVLAILSGYYWADFVTGFIHMACDNIPLSLETIKSGRTPWEWAAYGFHYHHIHPTDWNHNNIYFGAIVRAGFIIYVPLSLLTLSLDRHPFWQVLLYVCTHTGVLAQYTHAASHGRFHDNRLVKWLQHYRIILPPSVHKIHHQQFDQNYAILNGWSNPILNFIYQTMIAPYASESVSAKTQKQLYHDKKVHNSDGQVVFSVQSIPHQYVIFPDYRKHKGCPI